MSKVIDCKKTLTDLIKDLENAEDLWLRKTTEEHYCGIGKALDELIQAVRDEEFEKHEATLKSNCEAYSNTCGDCPAKGTRYCP